MVICIRCRSQLDLRGHALGCQATRRAVSDAELADALLRKGLLK